MKIPSADSCIFTSLIKIGVRVVNLKVTGDDQYIIGIWIHHHICVTLE